MTTLGPDEKICPYCAETIKAAAVKCRYCHSDLTEAGSSRPATPHAAEPAPAAVATGTAAASEEDSGTGRGPRISLSKKPTPARSADDHVPPPPPVVRDGATSGSQGLLASFRLLRILVALCLVLAVLTGVAWWYDHHGSSGSSEGPITSVQARDAGLAEATRLTQKILSYDWKTLDKDTKAAEAVMGPSFRAEYAKAMAGVKKQTLKNHVHLEAKAVATSIVSASEHKVVALVFVNQVTTAKGAQNQRLDQNRVLVTLTRGEGEWRVSKMDAF